MQQESGLERRLQEIRRKFGESLPGKAEHIAGLWASLQAGWSVEMVKNLYAEVHRLHGSCGTLGFGPVSEVASEIQILLLESLERQSLPDDGIRQRITELVGVLSGSCACRDNNQ